MADRSCTEGKRHRVEDQIASFVYQCVDDKMGREAVVFDLGEDDEKIIDFTGHTDGSSHFSIALNNGEVYLVSVSRVVREK